MIEEETNVETKIVWWVEVLYGDRQCGGKYGLRWIRMTRLSSPLKTAGASKRMSAIGIRGNAPSNAQCLDPFFRRYFCAIVWQLSARCEQFQSSEDGRRWST